MRRKRGGGQRERTEWEGRTREGEGAVLKVSVLLWSD